MAYEPELERLERRYQDDPARNFAQLAEAYRKGGRLDDALMLLQGHLTERPNYVSGLIVLGRCLLDQQNDAEARDTFQRVLGIDGEHIIALRALGEIAERAGDPGGAKDWFTRLLDVDPMNEDAEEALRRIAAGGTAPAAVVTPEPAEPAESLVAAEPVVASEPTPDDGGDETISILSMLADEPAAEEEVPAEPQVAQAPWGAGAAEDEEEVGEGEESEFVVEASSDEYMPRASAAQPMDVELVGEVEITSQLPDEQPLIGDATSAEPEDAALPADVPDEYAVYEFPTGEQEVDFGPDTPQEAVVDEPSDDAAAPVAEGAEMGITPFDDALGWGAGDRVSQQLSREDIEEAAQIHEATTLPVSELPGLESTEVPVVDEVVAVGSVEGLQRDEPGEVAPLEGFEPTVSEPEAGPVEILPEATEPIMLEPEPPAAAVEDAVPVAAAPSEPSEARPSMDLPLISGTEDTESEEPLVLEAEPEPVVTETMAELYVKQGLYEEARDVYSQLLARRPGDPKLEARLAELRSAAVPAAAPTPAVQYAAAVSGGQSVRAMMQELLAGTVGTVATVGAVDTAPPAAPPAPEPMDQAFSEESGDEAMGAPTQPASDEVSLASVFGDSSAPPAAAPASAPAGASPPETKTERAPGGFSFDEFFGKPGAEGEEPDRPSRDSLSDDEGDEAFRDWLKGLKG